MIRASEIGLLFPKKESSPEKSTSEEKLKAFLALPKLNRPNGVYRKLLNLDLFQNSLSLHLH